MVMVDGLTLEPVVSLEYSSEMTLPRILVYGKDQDRRLQKIRIKFDAV